MFLLIPLTEYGESITIVEMGIDGGIGMTSLVLMMFVIVYARWSDADRPFEVVVVDPSGNDRSRSGKISATTGKEHRPKGATDE